MSNNYGACTVTPEIPSKYLTPERLAVLERAGFSNDGGVYLHGGSAYFYCEAETGGPTDDDGEDGDCDWERVFGEISLESGLAIVIMGSYWSDKCRPGEFGGWVVRITPGAIRWDGTHQALARMEKEIPV
jgi:hypothetical protein